MPPISLSPIVFYKILRLPKTNKELNLPKEKAFTITNNGAPKILLTYFTNSLYGVNTNAYKFDIDFLKDPFREFAWLFVWITGQGSIEYFPQDDLFILCGTFMMNWSFDWAQIILDEISH